MIIVTTHKIQYFSVKDNKGLVTAHQVIGANLFSDFVASFSDIFGGTSGTYRNKLDDLQDYAIKQISSKAEDMGANAILGFRIEYDEISGKNKSMFMVTCTGTAVEIEPNYFEKYEKLNQLMAFLKNGVITQEQYDLEKEKIENSYSFEFIHDTETRQEIIIEPEELLNKIAITEKDEETNTEKIDLSLFEETTIQKIADRIEDLWMMSVENIENADLPNYVRKDYSDNPIINLICEGKLNEAAKLYSNSKNVKTSSAYNFIIAVCTSAAEHIQEE